VRPFVGARRREYEAFYRDALPRLLRAYAGQLGMDGAPDAAAEALAYAWAHWDRVRSMGNPIGYVYRAGLSGVRQRRSGYSPERVADLPEIEPKLTIALTALSPNQRSCVWLVHGCGWSYQDAAEALDLSVSAVGTHVSRALQQLRRQLGKVDSCR
jgi:DNA-directed RNA polymerase specialized sigma24 family protein